MKRLLLFGTTILTLFICSCSSQTRDNLPSGVVEDAVAEQMKRSMLDQSYTKLKTGYFECNEENTRITLAKLAAAGVISYKVERFAWWNKHLYAGSSNGSYYGAESYKYEEHFMVSVQLTEEGKEIMVDSIPMPEVLEDEVMKQPEIDLTTFPENNYAKENWPEIPCPEKKETAEKKQTPTDTVAAPKEKEEERGNVNNIFAEAEKKQDANTERDAWVALDVETKTKYEVASSKQKSEIVTLKSSALVVDDVRFIQTFVDQQSGLCRATAEVIVKTKDVTAAGRILDQKYDGTKLCATVNFVYYDDKGWILVDKDFRFSPTSEKWKSQNTPSTPNSNDSRNPYGTQQEALHSSNPYSSSSVEDNGYDEVPVESAEEQVLD